MSSELGQRPTTLLGIDPEENPWLAYTFDRAVMFFGMAVVADHQESYDAERREYTRSIDSILNDPDYRPGEKKVQHGTAAQLRAQLGNAAVVKP